MSQLPKQLTWPQASNQWPAILNPVIASPILSGQQIDGIILASGVPKIINHSLGQLPQGWFVVDSNAGVTPYRTQPFNTKTITLEANANVTVSIWIY